eukprot:jgi/Chrzof1/335/Cz01g12010.t1
MQTSLRGRQCTQTLSIRRNGFSRRPRCAVKCVATPYLPKPAGAPEVDGCKVFIDRDGDVIEVMCCDYGFRAGSGRLYQEKYGEVPGNVFEMASANFKHELQALRRSFRCNEYGTIYEAAQPRNGLSRAAASVGGRLVKGLAAADRYLEKNKILPALKASTIPDELQGEGGDMVDECKQIREQLNLLALDDQAVWDHEHDRIKRTGDVQAPWYIRAPFSALCVVLDLCFTGRPIQRFWVLETVARIPYFAFISILHLYESLGFWRAGAELRKIHFAEEWNELHHLQIMEALGGDQLWFDRFLAEHAAILYYWMLILFYLVSPRLAYMFSELVELHAMDTYTEFVAQNEDLLKSLPPPMVAAAYYRNEDLYMFDEIQTCSRSTVKRRPSCRSLYDVFANIRDDESEHVKTMHACQDITIAKDLAVRRRQIAD